MADIEQVKEAFRNAVASGDNEAATKFADYIDAYKPELNVQKANTLYSVARGMKDPIDEAATMLPKGLQAVTSLGGNYPNKVSDFFGSEASRVQDMNRAGEAEYQADNKGLQGTDVARLVGNVVSPTNLAIASKIPTAIRGLKAVGLGTGAGAIGGATVGTDVNSPNYWENKAKEMGMSALSGAGTSGLIATGARIIKPNNSEKLAELLRQKINPTIGQTLGGMANSIEEKAQSIPFLGDAIRYARGKVNEEFNTAALNRALNPIGEKSTSVGRTGMTEVKTKLGKAYDEILPKIGFIPDAQFNSEYANLQKLVSGLGPKEQQTYNRIMDEVTQHASANGGMAGETFKIATGHLNNKAKSFSSSIDPYQRELGDALNSTLDSMRKTLIRSNPQQAEKLRAIDTGYANYARLRQASSSVNAGAKEGVFSPAQLASAVKAQDKSVGKGASATGDALMQDLAEQGTNILGSKVSDSGTAGRLYLGGGTAAAALGTGTAIPTAIGLGAASLPYAPGIRQMTSAVLSKRPGYAKELAEGLRKFNIILPQGVSSMNTRSDNKEQRQ